MELPVFGAVGAGLVWGWLLGGRLLRPRHLVVVSLIAVTAAFAAEISEIVNQRSAFTFLCSVLPALCLHMIWISALKRRRLIKVLT